MFESVFALNRRLYHIVLACLLPLSKSWHNKKEAVGKIKPESKPEQCITASLTANHSLTRDQEVISASMLASGRYRKHRRF